jgi:hypothetical protein
MDRNERIIPIRVLYNSTCLKCNLCAPLMVKVGAFVMCGNCVTEEFGQVKDIKCDSVISEKYYRWVQVYKDKKY